MTDMNKFKPALVRTYPPREGLTESQLRWCRQNIPFFEHVETNIGEPLRQAERERLLTKERAAQ